MDDPERYTISVDARRYGKALEDVERPATVLKDLRKYLSGLKDCGIAHHGYTAADGYASWQSVVTVKQSEDIPDEQAALDTVLETLKDGQQPEYTPAYSYEPNRGKIFIDTWDEHC